MTPSFEPQHSSMNGRKSESIKRAKASLGHEMGGFSSCSKFSIGGGSVASWLWKWTPESGRPGFSLFSATWELFHLSFIICKTSRLLCLLLVWLRKRWDRLWCWGTYCARHSVKQWICVLSVMVSILQIKKLRLRETKEAGLAPHEGGGLLSPFLAL